MTESISTGVGYTREVACNFWLDFDRPFNGAFGNISNEMEKLINMSQIIHAKYLQSFNSDKMNLDEANFKNEIESNVIRQDIYNLANAQFDIIFNHFRDEKGVLDLNNLKRAFEDFGQGVLYDSKHDNERTFVDGFGNPQYYKKTENKMIFRIHKMDSEGQWTLWHSFMRAAGLTFPKDSKYFELDKLIAYSCMINHIVRPKQSFEFPNGEIPEDSIQNPNGPGSPEALEKAKFILDLKAFKELDKIIKTYDVSQNGE